LPRARENGWVGQSGEKTRFPGFDIMLTSGTFPATPTLRLSIEDVSESQKEFIDLAFRIALIRTSSEVGGAMLVLETPEANLDSLFIYNAGDLLRNSRTREGNREICCSRARTSTMPT